MIEARWPAGIVTCWRPSFPMRVVSTACPRFARRCAHGWSAKSELALLEWLDPTRLIARLHDEIDSSAAAAGDDQLRLSASERDKLIGAMVAVIDDYERQEEDLIARAADAGQDIPRRHDASPAAILGVRVTKRKAEAA